MSFDYDLFVIGGGSGGVRAARVAAETGAKVALAEEYRMGGTCVIRGCVPKKLMVFASNYSTRMAEAASYGWTSLKARSTGRNSGRICAPSLTGWKTSIAPIWPAPALKSTTSVPS